MKYLWDDINKITFLLKTKSPKLILLDFDGTLAPIVDRPEQAKLPKETKLILQRLSHKENFYIGILSGRRLSDVKKKIGIPNIIYGGNHGLQGDFFGKKFLHPAAQKAASVIKKIRLKAGKIAEKYEGVLIEDKKIALAFHYRMARQDKAQEIKSALDDVIQTFLDDKLISVISGKKEIDILPKAEWNKGDFAKFIIGEIYSKTKQHPAVIVIGDDATDENAFGDLKNDITVVVGEKLQSQAKYYLENPEEVSMLLDLLYAEKPQDNYLIIIKQISKILEEKDFDNKEFLEFWRSLVRDATGRWLKYYQQGIKYFKYGRQTKPNIKDWLQVSLIKSSINHVEAFLNGLHNENFRDLKHWLIYLHQQQSYFGQAGQTLSQRRISEGEHTEIVSESMPFLAKKYKDPYISKGVQIVYLPEIGIKGCPMDKWESKLVLHYYPNPKYFNQYLHVMRKKLEEFILGINKGADRKNLTMIANYYQYGINMHMFENINQSLFGNQANAMLKILGLKPIEHGIMDFVAMRLQLKNFAEYFIDEVNHAQI